VAQSRPNGRRAVNGTASVIGHCCGFEGVVAWRPLLLLEVLETADMQSTQNRGGIGGLNPGKGRSPVTGEIDGASCRAKSILTLEW
jgi:hypothetical protein